MQSFPSGIEEEVASSRLLRACIRGDLTAIRELRSDYSVKGLVDFENARTALHYVVLSGEAAGECSRVLLEAGCPADVVDCHGLTSLMLGHMYGLKPMIEVYQSRGIVVGGPYDSDLQGKWSNLMRACYANRVAQIQHCLERGDDPDESTSYGLTALHLAVHRGNTMAIQMLIANRCNINVRDVFGWTPLMISCRRGWKDLASSLLTQAADASIMDCEGQTVLHTALLQGNTDILSLVVQHSPELISKAFPQERETPMEVATVCQHEHVVRWFGEDSVPIMRSSLNASLTVAVKLGNFAIMRNLVAMGASVEEHHVAEAVHQDNTEHCRYLLACGVTLNIVTDSNRTRSPLTLACLRNNIQCMRILLEAGARPNSIEGGEELFSIPLTVAVLNGGYKVVFELLRAGADPDLDVFCVTATGEVCSSARAAVRQVPCMDVDKLPADCLQSIQLCLQAGADYEKISRIWHSDETLEPDPLTHLMTCPSLQQISAAAIWSHLVKVFDHGNSFIHLQRATELLPLPTTARDLLLFPYALPGRSVLSQLCAYRAKLGYDSDDAA